MTFYTSGDDQGEENGIRDGDTTGAISGVSGGVKVGDEQWSVEIPCLLEDGRGGKEVSQRTMIDHEETTREEERSGGLPHERKVIHSDRAPAAIGPYSQAICLGTVVFTSGSLGIDPGTGKLVDGGIEEQTIKALENLSLILRAAGSSLAAVVKTTVFVRDLKDFPVINKIYGEHFQHDPPARSTVEVAGLPLGALVEIEAIAAVAKERHSNLASKQSSPF